MLVKFKRINFFYLAVFLSSFLPLLVYWLSFYPGIFTYDSHYVWMQISTNNITDWHPAYYVILMWLLTRVWHSPASITLFQILIFAVVFTYAGIKISKDLSIPKWFVILCAFFISAIPLNGILLVTVWKDILYSIFVFLLVFLLWRINVEGNGWLSKNWFLLGIVSANVWLLRHNGPIVVIGFFLTYILFQRLYLRSLLLSIITTATVISLVKGPIYNLFDVNTKITQPFSVVYLHPIAAHVINHTEMTKTEEAILDQIHPLGSWAYSCYDATVLLYRGFNVNVIEEHSSFLLKTLLRFSVSQPQISLKHFLCQSSFIWNPIHQQGVLLETVYLNSSTDYPHWEKYADVVAPRPLLPTIRHRIEQITNHWLEIDRHKITWRPSFYLFAILISVLVFSFKTKNPRVLLIFSALLFQTIGIAFTSQYQGVRYQYPVYLISMFFSSQLFYWLIFINKNRRNLQK